MRQVLVYTNPEAQFNEENQTLVKLHIDNSLELGWKREDILLFTNFKYEHNGVKSQLVDGSTHVEWDKTSNKVPVIRDLLKQGLPKGLYWYHDFDAYQNEVITEQELGLDDYDIGLTGYGYKPQVNGGSFFFRENTYDFFEYWCKRFSQIVRTRADEKTLTDMTRDGKMNDWKWKMLNITYNFGQRCPNLCYEQADKPLKVLHFHPHYEFYTYHGHKNIEIMRGDNKHKIPMISERLSKIFTKYGY